MTCAGLIPAHASSRGCRALIPALLLCVLVMLPAASPKRLILVEQAASEGVPIASATMLAGPVPSDNSSSSQVRHRETAWRH